MRRWLVLLPILCLVLLALAVLAFNAGLFRSAIENRVAAATGAKVKLGSMAIRVRWPLTLSVNNIKIDDPAWSVDISEADLEVKRFFPPYSIHLSLKKPVGSFRSEGMAQRSPPGSGSSQAPANSKTGAIHLQLDVEQGELQLPSLSVKGIEIHFDQPVLLKSAARIRAQALVESNLLPVALPLSLQSEALVLSLQRIAGTDVRLSLLGLNARAQGESRIADGQHQWAVDLSIPDLSQVPLPRGPVRKWSGAVQAHLAIEKATAAAAWSAGGDIKAQGVKLEVDTNQNGGRQATVAMYGFQAAGPLSVDLDTRFQWTPGRPELRFLNGQLDLSGVKIVKSDLFLKPAGVPFVIRARASGDSQNVKFDQLGFSFWKIGAELKGQAALVAPYSASFDFNVPRFNLEGLEKILLPLGQMPAKGQVAARGHFEGPLTNPRGARILVKEFSLSDLSAELRYDGSSSFKARGPFTASLSGTMDIDAGRVKNADLRGGGDLKSLALVAGPFRKEAGQPFTFSGTIKNAGEDFDIKSFMLQAFESRIQAHGRFGYANPPRLNMIVEARPLDLSALRLAVPEYREKIPAGKVAATVQLSGSLDFQKPWSQWPLQVRGQVDAKIPQYVLPPTPAKAAAGKASAAVPASESAFLPSGSLTSRMNVKLKAEVSTIKKDALIIQGAHWLGEISRGELSGDGSIQNLFSGRVQLHSLRVPLLVSNPTVSGQLKWQDVVIEDALEFAKPEYKTFAQGKSSGQAEFQTHLPSDPRFLELLQTRGHAAAEPVTLNTVKLGDMINDFVKKASVLKLKPVRVEPLHGQLATDFDLQKQNLQLRNLRAQDVGGSELQAEGKVQIPGLQGDLVGRFFWAKPQVQGCLLEGNADSQGRMVIPVAVRGDLMKPGLSSISDLIQQLGAKALDCEKKKFVDKLKQEGGKKLENEVKKQLNDLFGH